MVCLSVKYKKGGKIPANIASYGAKYSMTKVKFVKDSF